MNSIPYPSDGWKLEALQQSVRDKVNPDPKQCGCHGTGWILSDFDTWHECPAHYKGQRHPEDDQEGEKTVSFYLKDGTLFANDYNRVVIGGQGPYIEFSKEHIVCELETEPGQEYRGKGKYAHCKYFWGRPKGRSIAKVYLQRSTVNYADYRPGMYYVSPDDLTFPSPLYAEVTPKPGLMTNSVEYWKEE